MPVLPEIIQPNLDLVAIEPVSAPRLNSPSTMEAWTEVLNKISKFQIVFDREFHIDNSSN